MKRPFAMKLDYEPSFIEYRVMSDMPRATDEDRALVAKSADDIRIEVSVFSFDVSALDRRVQDGNAAQAFIQAHLYLDHVVSRLLSENVPFPRQLQLDRSGFSQKLQLVAALGLLKPGHIAPIKVINSIRNKIAHQLDYAVQASDEAKLRSTIGKGADREEDGSQTPLVQLLRLLIVLVDLERQERAFERLMRMRAVANARVVLDRF